jgi:hypothetical protein
LEKKNELTFHFKVHFEKIPKQEKGFDFCHEDFDLDAKSQATLEIRYHFLFCLKNTSTVHKGVVFEFQLDASKWISFARDCNFKVGIPQIASQPCCHLQMPSAAQSKL